VLPRDVLEKIEIPERSSSDAGIRDDTLDVFGQLPPEPASVMEKLVMAKDSYFRINSLKYGIEREQPVRHSFVVKVVDLEARLKE